MDGLKTYYRRHLPHFQPFGATYHVVFRLKGSLPTQVIEQLRSEREQSEREQEKTKNDQDKTKLLRELRWAHFRHFDAVLDGNSNGPRWLSQPEIAQIVQGAMHYMDGTEYNLLAYCIMPNHVHKIIISRGFQPIPRADETSVASSISQPDGTGVPSYMVSKILGSIKKYTSRRANKLLHRRGAFWQDESYDHIIRDGKELERTIQYVIWNPVRWFSAIVGAMAMDLSKIRHIVSRVS